MKDVTYGITEEIYSLDGSSRKSYGIAAYADAKTDGTATILISVSDVSSDKRKLEELVYQANLLRLSPLHLHDVIEDFLRGDIADETNMEG